MEKIRALLSGGWGHLPRSWKLEKPYHCRHHHHCHHHHRNPSSEQPLLSMGLEFRNKPAKPGLLHQDGRFSGLALVLISG